MRCEKEVVITSDSSGEAWSAACWDPSTGSLLMTYRNASALPHNCVSILNDSYLLAADVTKPRLHLWPLNSQNPVENLRLSTPGKVSALSCSRNGCYIAAAIGEKLFIWQTSTGRLLRTVSKHYQTVTCLKFNADGSFFVSGGEDGLVFIWALANIANDHEEPLPRHGFSDHTLPVKDIYLGNICSKSRLISVSLDRTARIYDTNVGTQLLVLIFRMPLTTVCMDIKECNVFFGCTDGIIRQFNLQFPPRGNEFHVPDDDEVIFKGHTGNITCLSVSIDCTTLLSGGSDGIVNLWDIPSHQIVKRIPHKGPITTAIFSSANENYRAMSFKPKILVRPLQRVAKENGKNEIIEIISKHDDYNSFLNVEQYLESNASSDVSMKKSIQDELQIEKLKNINKELYKHLVNHLCKKTVINTNEN